MDAKLVEWGGLQGLKIERNAILCLRIIMETTDA